ncbi:MAG: right-handed parallel beta-helix repeat-containing protein, partial [Chloroflexi bacterium]|nr:right-handed parallel beta-helix repeat-containing protein [Chloroflexota bacterium]
GAAAVFVGNNNWTVIYNSIHNNPAPYALYYDGANGMTLDATNNWWGTTDVVEIADRIFDRNDDLNKGIANYNPLLMAEGGQSNHIPSATANANPPFGYIPLTVNLTGLGSDSDGSVASYEWDFEGDGVYDWSSTVNGNVSHQYTASRNYVAVFRVTDNLGLANKILVKVGAVQPGQAIDVGGEIPQNQTWSTGYSFRVTDNVIVPTGVTLTIEPNVEVRFATGKGLQVYGTLVARGTNTQPITFTTSSETPAAGAWQFLNFTDSSVDATFDEDDNYVSGSVLQYCKVLYGGGSGAPGAIQIQNAAPFIDNCQISHSMGLGIYATNPPDLRISNNTLSDNTRMGDAYHSSGGGIYLGGGNATITNNTVSNNTAYEGAGGINVVSASASTLISGNTITGNRADGNSAGVGGVRVASNTAGVTIRNNTISANGGSAGSGGAGGGIKTKDTHADVVIDGNTMADNVFGGGWEDAAGIDLWGSSAPISLTNNTITGSQGRGVNAVNIGALTIRGNTVSGSAGYLGIGIYIRDGNANVVIDHNTVESNDEYGAAAVFVGNNNWTVIYNSIHNNPAPYALYYDGANGMTLDATNNWWGTTDASVIVAQVYDFEDNLLKGQANVSPILGTDSSTPPAGPTNPTVSITGYAGTTADPIVALALSATGAAQMLISDDHTFPPQFAWESFAATKEFHSDGTKYIYARFKDAAGDESAIAFARPQRILYINKGATLASLPALIQARLAADASGGAASIAAVGSAQAIQAMTYYRRAGTSDYTALPMALADGIRSAWIPASALAGGVEYYLQVEDGGTVLATLPESNPADNPFTLAATSMLEQSVRAASENVFELAVGLSFAIPAGALPADTDLRVAAAVSPTVPPGITLTGIGYQFTLADGTTTFARPVSITFNYADSQVAGLDVSRLRVYTVDGGALKLVGGTPNPTSHTVQVEVGHFSDFLLAEGSVIYPAAVTQAFVGEAVMVQASVVNYLPARAATLYYRPGNGGWQSLSMMQNGAYLEAAIPAGDVTAEELVYYITASDGAQMVSFPVSDPANHPQVITITSRPAPVAMVTAAAEPSTPLTVTLPNAGGQIALPAGLVTTTTIFTYSEFITPTQATGGFIFAGRSFTLEATDANGRPITTFAGRYTITLNYQESDWQNAGIPVEENLNLYYWNGTTWVAVLPCAGCTLDTVNNRITAVLDHLTEFALLGNPLAAPAVSAARDLSGVELRWTQTQAGVARYEVYRSTQPYFTPDGGSLLDGNVSAPGEGHQATFTDPFGEPRVNYYYVVVAVGAGEVRPLASNRVGAFHFTLTPGAQ